MQSLRSVALVLLFLGSHFACQGQDVIQTKDSVDLQFSKVFDDLALLQSMVESMLSSELQTEKDTILKECPQELQLRQLLSERMSSELDMWHSTMRFSAEDLLGDENTLGSMRDWLDSSELMAGEFDLELEAEALEKLTSLKSGLETFDKVKKALASKECYVSGLSPELKEELYDMPQSMKRAGRTARAMLTMAPGYRELACDKMDTMEGEPLISLMAFWIYDGQFSEKDKFKASLNDKGFRQHIDWLEPSIVRSMLSEFPEFYLNEERLRLYSWLNDVVIQIMFEEATQDKLCGE